jgi:hypothetical protein
VLEAGGREALKKQGWMNFGGGITNFVDPGPTIQESYVKKVSS